MSAEVTGSRAEVIVNMVLRFQCGLKLCNCSVKIKPAFALRDLDSPTGDAGCHKPALDSIDRLVSRGKKLDNLFLGEVLAIFLRCMIGTGNVLVEANPAG